jgi:hypothetical protein
MLFLLFNPKATNRPMVNFSVVHDKLFFFFKKKHVQQLSMCNILFCFLNKEVFSYFNRATFFLILNKKYGGDHLYFTGTKKKFFFLGNKKKVVSKKKKKKKRF